MRYKLHLQTVRTDRQKSMVHFHWVYYIFFLFVKNCVCVMVGSCLAHLGLPTCAEEPIFCLIVNCIV